MAKTEKKYGGTPEFTYRGIQVYRGSNKYLESEGLYFLPPQGGRIINFTEEGIKSSIDWAIQQGIIKENKED